MTSNRLGELLKIELEYTQGTESEKVVCNSWGLFFFKGKKEKKTTFILFENSYCIQY